MMKWFQRRKVGKADGYNETTEPLPYFDPTAFGAGPAAQEDATLPVPQSQYPQFPNQPAQPGTTLQQPPYAPPAYPYVAQPPGVQQNQPGSVNGQTQVQPGGENSQKRTKRHPIPLLVGLVFVYIEFVLLLRFVLKLISFLGEQAWANSIYGMSDPFVEPFRLLWQQIPLQLPAPLEVYTLLAVLVYSVCSRVLVHLLKLVLNAR